MYWPDYSPRKKKPSPWRGIGVVMVLFFSLLMAGELNGWWQLTPTLTQQAAMTTRVLDEQGSPAVVLETAVPVGPTRTPLPAVAAVTTAPAFQLPDLFDDERTLALSDYAGQPVILNFWASWCVPCRDEMQALERAYQQYREQGLVVLGINQLYVDDLDAAQAFVRELQLTFANAADETGQVSERRYQVVGLPTSVFITPSGEITHVQIGQMTDTQIDNYSQRLMAGREITP